MAREVRGLAMTLGSHQQAVGKSQSHFTPRWILDRLGFFFDTDPCAGNPRPWDIGKVNNFTEADNGLIKPWEGRVFLNPPFDSRLVAAWVDRLARHGNGVLLIHARTETAWFSKVWSYASSILFLDQRLKFLHADGTPQKENSGAPVILASFDGGPGEQVTIKVFNEEITGRVVDWGRPIGEGPNAESLRKFRGYFLRRWEFNDAKLAVEDAA